MVAGKMRRPRPCVPHVQLTRGGASRGGSVVGDLLRDAQSASSSRACGPTGARLSAGSCPPAGRCWLRCWVSCRPEKERWSACRSRVRRRRRARGGSGAVRCGHAGAPCCYSERSANGRRRAAHGGTSASRCVEVRRHCGGRARHSCQHGRSRRPVSRRMISCRDSLGGACLPPEG